MSITEIDESTSQDAAATGTAAAALKSEDTTAVVADSLASAADSLASAAEPTNGASASAAPLKSEESPAENEGEPAGVDEVDNFFSAVEEQQHAQETEHAHDAQPDDATTAPKLLQHAIKEGKVGVDDSEAESEDEHKKKKKAAAAAKKKEDEKKEEAWDHVHHRLPHDLFRVFPSHGTQTSQLDFFLSRAKEYSDFISADIDELQSNLQAQAAEASGEGAKKCSKEECSKKKKKRKKNNGDPTDGEVKLASAQDKYTQKNSAMEKGAIFIQPKNLASGCKLKDYQLEGVRWLVSLYENGVSGILADEMGLGKTIQVIALIAHLRTMTVSGPFIIIAPFSTLPNWVRELQKWLPELPVVHFHGSARERDAMLAGPLNTKLKKNADYPVIVTSHEVAIRDEKRLNKIGEYTYLVVDEGQRLKNNRCTLIQSLKRIKSANRLLLSGTPIQNNLDELWSLLNFVNPAIFDDLSIFQSWFGFRNIGEKLRVPNQTVTKLHEILRPFLRKVMKIGMNGVDGNIDWCHIHGSIPLYRFLRRYAVEKGVSSTKSLVFKHNGSTLFSSNLKRTPTNLGIKDGELLYVSMRQSTLSHEIIPLKELYEGSSSNKGKLKSSKGNAKGNRKKSSLYVSPEEEETKLRQWHWKAMIPVFEEADKQFREIRRILNDLTLKRMPPKDKIKSSNPAMPIVPVSTPLTNGVGGKAGKSSFVALVGEAANLYKTTKPTAKHHTQGRGGCNTAIDLHGMTKEQALSKLDKSLPNWMTMAMKGTYPFVIQVQIVCGGGSQILAEAVENWIRQNKNVANAPKSRYA